MKSLDWVFFPFIKVNTAVDSQYFWVIKRTRWKRSANSLLQILIFSFEKSILNSGRKSRTSFFFSRRLFTVSKQKRVYCTLLSCKCRHSSILLHCHFIKCSRSFDLTTNVDEHLIPEILYISEGRRFSGCLMANVGISSKNNNCVLNCPLFKLLIHVLLFYVYLLFDRS